MGLMVRFVCLFLVLFLPASGEARTAFEQWLDEFRAVAGQQGVNRATWDRAFAGVAGIDDKVLEKASYQPEFTTKIWDYLDGRVNPISIANGQKMDRIHDQTLTTLAGEFGVKRSVLLAIWSMESNYGKVLQRPDRLHYVPQALATLAYADSKRQRFGRTQLIAALKILQAGDVSVDQFSGSWAGAMGHTQFIPTSYLAYGIDMDGDGRRDIWNSIPDALATAANLLHKNGWRSNKSWGYEVILPPGSASLEGQTKLLSEWQKLGFKRPENRAFPQPDEKAVLKLLAGERGPGFLMMRNFFVLKRYNNADAYALGVGLLADRLAGYSGMVQCWPRPPESLNAEEKIELQQLLQQLGFYKGEIDGNPGKGTRAAIAEFQKKTGVVPDGLPTRSILINLRDQ
ncbi:MAG: lytic murein transglycosylase [Desulfofustis sp.]|nr:lytic murein transglycosylase [Desulfofustis sp.]